MFTYYFIRLVLILFQIPEKTLEHSPRRPRPDEESEVSPPTSVPETPFDSADEEDIEDLPTPSKKIPRRRLSTFESADSVMDLESDRIGGSARPRS